MAKPLNRTVCSSLEIAVLSWSVMTGASFTGRTVISKTSSGSFPPPASESR